MVEYQRIKSPIEPMTLHALNNQREGSWFSLTRNFHILLDFGSQTLIFFGCKIPDRVPKKPFKPHINTSTLKSYILGEKTSK